MLAILRPITLFLGLYATAAVAVTLATGSLVSGLLYAIGTTAVKFVVTMVWKRAWDRIDRRQLAESFGGGVKVPQQLIDRPRLKDWLAREAA